MLRRRVRSAPVTTRCSSRPSARCIVEAVESRRLLASLPTGFTEAGISGSIINGTAMAFAPDGKLYVLEQGGTIEVYQGSGSSWSQVAVNGNLLSRASNVNANHIAVNASGERGLLGVAFHPNFSSNRFIYVYYTTASSPIHNRISRFTVNTAGTQVIENSEQVLVDLDNLSGATNHNGGAMHFGLDGKLYVAVGDNATSANAQSIANRHGKMLRYNDDGTIPSDNPTTIAGITGTLANANRAIWAAGLRNPYTFSVHPTSGTIYINDVGQNTWEEVNVGAPGANYGWSATEGRFNQSSFPSYTNPIIAYPHNTSTAPYPAGPAYAGFAITGGVFYTTPAAVFPQSYLGDYFYADYVSDFIRTYDHATNTTSAFATGALGAVDLRVGPDGRLYYLARDASASGVGRVFRVDFTGNALPYVLQQPANQNVAAGQTATFTVQAGGPGTISYQWQRGTTDIAGANSPTYSFTVAPGDANATFRVRVTNAAGSVFSDPATLTVAVNNPPVPTIVTPVTGTTFTYGSTINYSGSATDPEEGTITNGSRFSWRVSYFTGGLERPFVPETAGSTSGSFQIPSISPYTSTDVFYRIFLTVTDSAGNSTLTYRDLQPVVAQVTLSSNPAGVPLLLDGSGQSSPHVFMGVAGQTRTIEAPSSFDFDGQTYAFQNWSDGGARVHEISTPSVNTTFTANYRDVTAPVSTTTTFSRERITPDRPPHELIFNFSEAVKTTPSALLLENLTTGQTIATANIRAFGEPANKRVRFTFADLTGSTAPNVLPDGLYRATLSGSVSDSADNPLGSNVVFNFRVLSGDADDNGMVNFDDLLTLARNYGATGRTFAQGNFDYDVEGLVDFDDLLLLARRYGTTLLDVAQTKTAATARKRSPVIDLA